VKYVGLLLVLLIALPAHAERTRAVGFDAQLTAEVYTTALEFIPPRTLEPVSTAQLTLWGLRGLTALDPDLVVDRPADAVRLSYQGTTLLSLPPPQLSDSTAWSLLAVRLTDAAWKYSSAVRLVGTQGVIQAFFDNMLGHLDPYSRYIAPTQASDEEEAREGNAGVGMDLERQHGRMVVASITSDGPAALKGIRPGDVIRAVDGHSTADASSDDVEDWLGGYDGTTVELRVSTQGKVRTVTLTRAQVPEENVFSFRDDDNLLLRITSFNSHTASRLGIAIETGFATQHRPTGIILDLRGNRGGLLYQAAAASDEFLPAGVVATTKGRDPAADHVFRSSGNVLAPDLPMVVLVDGRTASAAEVMAAALADHDRAVVIGSATLGKGLVQIVTRLPDGGELLLTWSRIIAPRGWPLQGFGVLPQLCTSQGETMANKELSELSKGVRPLAGALRKERAARAPVPASEILAVRNACPAAEGTDLDLDMARDLLADHKAYSTALLPQPRKSNLSAAR
jgi:carboxyl-terminal processing protease